MLRDPNTRVLLSCSALLFAVSAGGTAWADERSPDKSGTFSIVAIEPDTGICGAAVASRYPAVGSVGPYVRGGVGAVCTQHYYDPTWGKRALELLSAGKSAGEVLVELTRDDARAGTRQLGIVDRLGRTAQLNPVEAPTDSRWWGAASGRFYACQGNTLTGREVVA